MNQIRVRFAPSPTGSLHVGGARTAIYNWAFARHFGGTFILRIEDTDPERSTPENTAQIIRSLRWLGLNWDEGPESGGTEQSYLQSDRLDLYAQQIDILRSKDAAYPCFCTAEELADRRNRTAATQIVAARDFSATQTGQGRASVYDRRCRSISTEDANERIAAGHQHTWRLKIPLEREPVVFSDMVYGQITTPYQQMDDLILMRSDGTPTYNYACVIDDIDMAVTHVIRGDDHISNTPKQILIYEALGVTLPSFAHLPMIHGADGSKLSKRHGATSVESYRDLGYLPEALVNYLALLGWSLDGQTTLIDPQMLADTFTLQRVSRNPAVFDAAKLDWMNATYIKNMGARAFGSVFTSWLEATDQVTEELLLSAQALYPLIGERVKTFAEIIPMTTYLFSGSNVRLDSASVEKCLRTENVGLALAEAQAILADPGLNWNHDSLEKAMRALVEKLGIKTKILFQAIRVAICGNMVSPPLFESMELIGRDDSLARIRAAESLIWS